MSGAKFLERYPTVTVHQCDELIERCRSGLLTLTEMQTAFGGRDGLWGKRTIEQYLIHDGKGSILNPRQRFIETVGFVLLTIDYINSLQRLVGTSRVLEVGAGAGTLAGIMKRFSGNDGWIATDDNSWRTAHLEHLDGIEVVGRPGYNWPATPSHVRVMDALEAAKTVPYDILFFSWWPLDDRIDGKLIALDRPTIMIGEFPGGCTGSLGSEEDDDYECSGPRIEWATDRYDWFVDVAQWAGLHDGTMLFNWPED